MWRYTGSFLVLLGMVVACRETDAYGQIQAMPPYGTSSSGHSFGHSGETPQAGSAYDTRQAVTSNATPDHSGYAASYTRAMQGPAFPSSAPSPPGLATPYGPSLVDPNVLPAQVPAGVESGLPHETVSWGEPTQVRNPDYPPAAADAMPVQPVYSTLGSSHSASPYWSWQVVPAGIIYKSYLAGGREPRLGSQWVYESKLGWLWDSTLGGRIGLIRYGTTDAAWPEGWQLDFEGAAFPRLDVENDRDLVAVDFRFGAPLTFRKGPWEGKVGYYHICSHIGDEYLQTHLGATRLNYVRDAIVLGLAARPHPDLRIYAEAGYGVWTDGGAEPWEFQFGIDYSPAEPSGILGAPFLAVNGHLREEINYSGSFTAQAGVQWRGEEGNLFRLGAHYFNGLSDQYQFLYTFEEQIGVGLWYDF